MVTGSGGFGGGRVLVWDPAEPGTGPAELGRGEDAVRALAVMPDGRVVTGSGWVRLWNVQSSSPALCSHAPRTHSLLPSHHLELASSSVMQ